MGEWSKCFQFFVWSEFLVRRENVKSETGCNIPAIVVILVVCIVGLDMH